SRQLERRGASDVDRTFLAAADADHAPLKPVASKAFDLSIARHQAHHASRWEWARAHGPGDRCRQLQVLRHPEADHRPEHLLARVGLPRPQRPRLIDTPPTLAKGRSRRPEHWSVPGGSE